MIASRFNGPARSANGGYACGSLAERVLASPGHVVEVTLRLPPPMDVADVRRQLGRVGHAASTARTWWPRRDRSTPTSRPSTGWTRTKRQRRCSATPGARAIRSRPASRAAPTAPRATACGSSPGPVGGERGHVASLWVPAESQTGVRGHVGGAGLRRRLVGGPRGPTLRAGPHDRPHRRPARRRRPARGRRPPPRHRRPQVLHRQHALRRRRPHRRRRPPHLDPGRTPALFN